VDINIIGSASHTGYGQVCRNIIIELHKAGHRVSFFPKGPSQFNDGLEEVIIKESIDNSSFFSYEAPTVSIWHQHSLAERVGRGKHYVFPYFELDRFSDREKHHLRGAEKIIAASGWAANILASELGGSVDDYPVVQAGVNRNIFHCNTLGDSGRTYRFINIGKWERRKGHEEIIAAFSRAFSPSDNVELVLMTHNPFLSGRELDYWLVKVDSSLMRNKIRVLGSVSTQYEVAANINKCDCGIFMSRAEGWNLDLLEVMSCGKPVITTRNSGMEDFVSGKNETIIETSETELAYDGKWFFNNGNWAKLGEEQIEQAAKEMRCHFENKTRYCGNGVETAKQFSWRNSAEQLLKILAAS